MKRLLPLVSAAFLFNGCGTSSPFLKAVSDGNTVATQSLIASGANIEEAPVSGRLRGQTALILAVRNRDHEMAKLLLDKGASPNASEPSGGKTALHFAVLAPDLDSVKLLIEKGADMNRADKSGKSPLDHANRFAEAQLFGKNSGPYLAVAEYLHQAGARGEVTNRPATDPTAGQLAAFAGAIIPGAALATGAVGLRQTVQTGLNAAQSAKTMADTAERAEGLQIKVPESFADKKVVVLPLDNLTNDLQGPLLLRQLMQMQLAAAGYRSESSDWIDKKLKELGITDGGQLPSRKPDELGAALQSDALLYAELTEFKNQNLGGYAARTVEAHAWLVDAKTGGTLWEATKRKSNRRAALTGDAIKAGAVTGYAGSMAEKAMGNPLRQETEDVVRMLVKDMTTSLDKK